MNDEEQQNNIPSIAAPSAAFALEEEPVRSQTPGNGRTSELGRYVASLITVSMLMGIAIALHAWMPEGGERTMLIMAVSGVGAWVIGAFTLHLSIERAPVLGLLALTAVFFTALVLIIAVAQNDMPEGMTVIEPPAAATDHGEQ